MKANVAAVVAVVGFALLCLQVQATSGQLKVAAFNIKNLGMSRLQRSWLTNVIVQVSVQHYYNDSYTKRILCKYNLTLHNNTIQVLIIIIQSVKFVWRCGEVLLRAVQSNLAAVAAVHAAHSLVGPVWGVTANTKEHALWWSGPQPSMPTMSSLLNICKYLWVLTAVHVHGLLTCNFIIISIYTFLHTSTEKCILII